MILLKTIHLMIYYLIFSHASTIIIFLFENKCVHEHF